MSPTTKPVFMPELHVPIGTMNIDFYTKAFSAVVIRRFDNEDGSVHAAELTIDGTMFILHEENSAKGRLTPLACNGVTATIGFMVADVDSIMAAAIAAGAKEVSPAEDYDYGYRQGELIDPFGHKWMIESII